MLGIFITDIFLFEHEIRNRLTSKNFNTTSIFKILLNKTDFQLGKYYFFF